MVFGTGSADSGLLVVGEGPGRDEDLSGEPFVGRSGQLLDRLIDEELGLTRASFYIANVVKCRPPGNRDPAPDEVLACSGFLDGQVAALDKSRAHLGQRRDAGALGHRPRHHLAAGPRPRLARSAR